MAIYGAIAACGIGIVFGLIYLALLAAFMADPPRNHDGSV